MYTHSWVLDAAAGQAWSRVYHLLQPTPPTWLSLKNEAWGPSEASGLVAGPPGDPMSRVQTLAQHCLSAATEAPEGVSGPLPPLSGACTWRAPPEPHLSVRGTHPTGPRDLSCPSAPQRPQLRHLMRTGCGT